eukprot:m.252606 g.252606  ORF g.252606 m.252606 type:complete len:92 (-) comp17526_c0_seq21:7156-7431(-)
MQGSTIPQAFPSKFNSSNGQGTLPRSWVSLSRFSAMVPCSSRTCSLGQKKVLPVLRRVLLGGASGPSIFATMELLGCEECVARLDLCLGQD